MHNRVKEDRQGTRREHQERIEKKIISRLKVKGLGVVIGNNQVKLESETLYGFSILSLISLSFHHFHHCNLMLLVIEHRKLAKKTK